MARIERDPSGRSGDRRGEEESRSGEQKRRAEEERRRVQKIRYGSAGDKGKDVISDSNDYRSV